MNSYEHQRLRKQYYKSYDIPFCECGGTFHYDKTICEFVCDECGAVVKVSDRDRSKKGCKKKEPDKCIVCGKPLKQKKGKGRLRKTCSNKCRQQLSYMKDRNTVQGGYTPFENEKQRNKDSLNYDGKFHQDDNYWRLGESNLTEHKAKKNNLEAKYIRKEKRRLLRR